MKSDDPRSYSELLTELKSAVRCAQSSAVRAINRRVIELYWSIGRTIIQREEFESWESEVVDTISRDLLQVFPGSMAFSADNIRRMRQFFLAYTRDYLKTAAPCTDLDGLNLPEVLTYLPWRHNILLVELVQEPAHRLWYAQNAAEQGWSLKMLERQIRDGAHRQFGQVGGQPAVPSADLAREILADPFNAEFLRLIFA
ncbi:MAG TPA: DUF1016 N-terminal domain-containing protein [Acidobacteriota bacterium]|nr:DUF1016 N-terminal domain-containing protein [Acidobacteriota bacterium]